MADSLSPRGNAGLAGAGVFRRRLQDHPIVRKPWWLGRDRRGLDRGLGEALLELFLGKRARYPAGDRQVDACAGRVLEERLGEAAVLRHVRRHLARTVFTR